MKVFEILENNKINTIQDYVNAVKALGIPAFTQVGVEPSEVNLPPSPGQKDVIFFNDFPTPLFIKKWITSWGNRFGREINKENGAQNILNLISDKMDADDPFRKRFTLQDAQKMKDLWDQLPSRVKQEYTSITKGISGRWFR